MEPTWRSRARALAPLPLRLVLGLGFLVRGYPKLFTAAGNEGFVEVLGSVGVPVPGLVSYLVGSFEFFGGILLILGVGVRVIALLGATEMAFAVVTVHWVAGIPGYEAHLLYIGGFLSLLISGSGPLSLPAVRPRSHARAAPEHGMEPAHGMKKDPADGDAEASAADESDLGARR